MAIHDSLLAREGTAGVLDQELVRLVPQNASIDWTERETAPARLWEMVKRTLRRYRFPEETREAIVMDIMTQAKLFNDEWVA